jgi:hypothetical protein
MAPESVLIVFSLIDFRPRPGAAPQARSRASCARYGGALQNRELGDVARVTIPDQRPPSL